MGPKPISAIFLEQRCWHGSKAPELPGFLGEWHYEGIFAPDAVYAPLGFVPVGLLDDLGSRTVGLGGLG